MHVDLHAMRFDWVPSPDGIGPGVAALARTAESVGVRTLSFMDHWFQDERLGVDDPMLEGYTALGFVAGCTTTLRLRQLVTGVTFRHPGLLAKTVTTLDVLSGGRAELGIGAAWYEREHRGLGVPFPPVTERFERLEEAIQICLQMWSDDDGPFVGRHYRLEETRCSPPPVSRPRPRIMVGGSGERKTLRLVATYGDLCNLISGADDIAHKLDVLRRHCDDVGRDPNEIEVTAVLYGLGRKATPDDLVARAEELGALGVSTVMVRIVGDDPPRWLETVVGPARDRVREIRPQPL